MKNKRLFWGIILLFIGVIALLASLGVFEFSWLTARKLWPILLIIIGVMILPTNDTIKAIIFLVTLAIGCLLYHYEAKKEHSFLDLFSAVDIGRPKTAIDKNTYKYACSAWGGLICKRSPDKMPFESGNTRLEVQMGSGSLSICGICDDLAEATQGGNNLNITSTRSNDNNILTVSTLKRTPQLMRGFEKPVNIKLNEKPVWDFDISTGAASVDIDLSRHKAERIDIATTTGNIKVKIGKYDFDSELSITSGVSKISITIPKDINCTIDCASALAYKDFDRFIETEENHWQLASNNETNHNLRIRIDAGAGIVVVRS